MSKLALLFSDLHIHNYKQFDHNGSRLENCLRVLDRVFVFADKNGIDTILFAGDLYDRQQALPTVVINATVERFHALFVKYPTITFYAISGNHDQASKNLLHIEAETALKHLSIVFENKFILIDNQYADIQDDAGNIARVVGVPYYEMAEHYAEKLAEVTNDFVADATTHILLCHQTPKGIMNTGIPFDTDPTDGVYEKYDMVFCGHIHAGQDLSDNFKVVGSPIHRDKADEGTDKGFFAVDLFNPKNTRFFSLNKHFPTFKSVFEDMIEGETNDELDWVVVVPRLDQIKQSETAKVESFNTSLSNEQLVRNFWEQQDGQNKELLEMGLSFIN